MVHALSEARRVARPGGIVIDLRPLATEYPILIVGNGGAETVGSVDGSATRQDDNAAERAVSEAVARGWLQPDRDEKLSWRMYWDGAREMLEYVQGSRSFAGLRPPPQRLEEICAAAGVASGGTARVCVVRTMILRTYTLPVR